MPSTVSSIVTLARLKLIEISASFWTDDELTQDCIAGIRDLWRDIVDLKQEHYLTTNSTDVFLASGDDHLSGVPTDVHKVYMVEPRDLTTTSANAGLSFKPKELNHDTFRAAKSQDPIDPSNATIWYAITGQGAPVNAPTIYIAPKVTSLVNVNFIYIPTLGAMTSNSIVPIPGEADNALRAWTIAFARSKEREDRSPDENWLAIYATEKQHLLQSLGLREYQEPKYVDAMFEGFWG